jgi:predicted Ser/Thr protein kinase
MPMLRVRRARVRLHDTVAAPKLERYEILGELGQGGMSVVYHAHDRQLSRAVAVKVLHDFLARQDDARRRFHREAVAVAKLHHPGILEIFDYSGPDAEPSYIVTELIEGRTLRELIEAEGPLPFPELGVLIALELVRALRHAHERGVIHRDLKPENVMITGSGQLKLMDFGIAQIMGGSTKVTATGTLLGSPAHMPPEVIDGQTPDHRADIFSLGTIIYWLCTHRLPFDAPNPAALFRQILENDYEPPEAVQPRVGNGLSRIIERTLARDPVDRYQDVSELESELVAELEAVELTPPELMVRELLRGPRAFADALGPRLVDALVRGGKRALGDKNLGRALDRFNRVLAIEPAHPEVAPLVARLTRRSALGRQGRRLAVAGGLIGALAGGGALLDVPQVMRGEAAVVPPSAPGTGVALPAPSPASTERAPPAPLGEAIRIPPAPSAELRPAPAPDPRPAPRAPDPAPAKLPPRRPGTSARPVVAAVVAPAAPAPEAEPPAPVAAAAPAPRAKLRVRIGRSWAEVVVDGQRHAGFYSGAFDLAPGRHTLEVLRPDLGGRYRVRTLEVTDDATLYEIGADGRRRAVPGELLFVIPRSREEAGALEGWISS